MSIRDRRFERSVRTQARARGIDTWVLTHPAGWLGWIRSGVAFVLLITLIGAMITIFAGIAVVCAAFDYFESPSVPLPLIAQLHEVHRLAVLALPLMFGPLMLLLRMRSFHSATVENWRRICPVPDATIRRHEIPRGHWWMSFTITLFVLLALEWIHGTRTLGRWISAPAIAALMTTITLGSARVMWNLIPRSAAQTAATVAFICVLATLIPAMTVTGNFNSYWASPWFALLPTAWPLYAWRSGWSLDSFWWWGTTVAAIAVWSYGRWLMGCVPIRAQEVEDQLYERPLVKPLFRRSTPPAERIRPSERVQGEFLAMFGDPAERTPYQRWLDWPATYRDLAIAEFSGWIPARPKPEWALASPILGAMLGGRLLVWLSGGYASLFDVVFVGGVIFSALVIELNPYQRAMEQPISFDDSLRSVLRVAIARLKRFVPYLLAYAVMLVVVEQQSWLVAAGVCFGPPLVLLTFVPLIVAGPVLFRSAVAVPQRFGLLLGAPMIILCYLAAPMPFVLVTFVLDKLDPPKSFGGAALYLTALSYELVAVVLARYLLRRGTFDL
ncbi:MAG: hypothetical protein U0795_14815 [Pirellulales bacterium]